MNQTKATGTTTTTKEEVGKKSVLKDLNPTKAVDPDLVHNNILTAIFHVIAEELTLLFNKSLTEGHFPSIWKTAHVTPIHKKGEKKRNMH